MSEGLFLIIEGILIASTTRVAGMIFKTHYNCQQAFWIRVCIGVPLYLLAATMIEVGFSRL